MKLFQVIASLVVLVISFAFLQMPPALSIGDPLPLSEKKMKDISGKDISLKEAAGAKGLLVMFSCNSCPFVIKNQSRTRQVCQLAQSKNIGVILINSNEARRNDDDSFEAMQSYAKEQGYTWLYALDYKHEIADAFGANRTPEVFLFDANLKLSYHGAIDDNPSDAKEVKREHLKVAIEEMTTGKEVTMKETRSIGCTIKR